MRRRTYIGRALRRRWRLPALRPGRRPSARRARPPRRRRRSRCRDADLAALKDKGYKAALLWHTSSDFVNAVTAGATDEFARAGIQVVVTTDAGFDAAKQRTDIETALAARPDVILSLPLDPVTSAEAFREAVEDGVKLVFLSNVPGGLQARHRLRRDRHRRPVPDGQAGGGRAGQGASAARARSARSSTTPTYYVTNQRDKAFKTTIEKDYPDIKIVAEQGISDPARAEEMANAMLLQNPDLDGIYVTWAEPADGVLAALRAAGNTHTKIVTLDLSEPVALDMVKGGNVAASSPTRPTSSAAPWPPHGMKALLGKATPAFIVAPGADGDQGQCRRGLAAVAQPRRAAVGARRGEVRSSLRRGSAAPERFDMAKGEALAIGRMTMSNANISPGGSFASRINLQQYVVYLGFLAIFLFFAIVLRDSGFLTVAQPLQHRAADGADHHHGDRPGLRAVGRRDRPLDRLDRRRLGARRGGHPRRLRHGGGHPRRPRRRPADRADQRRAGRLCPAAVVPGDAGDAGPVRRRRPLAHRPALDPGHRRRLHRLLRLRLAARHSVADLVDGRSPSPIGHLVFRETRFGAHVLATGDNARAAQVSGISVPRIRLAVLMLSGGLAGLAGLLYAGRLQAAKYTLGETDLMTVIAAVIVGGTLLNGGKGSIVGALVGSLMMGMLNNGLILMGLSVSDQMIVRGLIILVAVAVSLREKTR